MSKLPFVTFIFLLFALSAKAQIVESGVEYENRKSALHHPYILGKIDGEFIVIRLSGYR